MIEYHIHLEGHGLVNIRELMNGERALNVESLANALAKINRYAGNTRVPWNDAEHSVLVAHLAGMVAQNVWTVIDCEDRDANFQSYLNLDEASKGIFAHLCVLWGLLHDVVETVVGDTPSPVKRLEQDASLNGAPPEATVEKAIGRQIFHQCVVKLWNRWKDGRVRQVSSDQRLALQNLSVHFITDIVKTADIMALLVEVQKLHQPDVYPYCLKAFGMSAPIKDFVEKVEWNRIDAALDESKSAQWRVSAVYWQQALRHVRMTIQMVTDKYLSV